MKSRLPLQRLACLLLCLTVAMTAACGSKRTVPTREGESPEWMGTIRDLRTFPQDLAPFARRAGGSTPLLSEQEQQIQDARFNRIFFGPWDMTRTSVKRREMNAPLRKARGYKYDNVRWTQEEWDAIARNADSKHFPSMQAAAITVRYTDLREIPTHMPRYSEPTPDPRANPFDYNQYSLLPVGTPLLLAHRSRDGQWYYVETPVAAGWVDAKDVALADESFQSRYRRGSFAAVLNDKVRLDGTQTAYAHIGAVLPLASSTPFTLKTPPGGNGEIRLARGFLPEQLPVHLILEPGRERTCPIALFNPAEKPLSLTLNAAAPDGVSVTPEREVVPLQPGETRAVTLHLRAAESFTAPLPFTTAA